MAATSRLPSVFERTRIVLIQPDGFAVTAMFDELALCLSSALRALGCVVDIAVNEIDVDSANLVIGAHLLGPGNVLPSNSILLNFEQFDIDSPFLRPCHLEQLRRHVVLDTSRLNVERLRVGTGNRQVRFLGIGYRAELSRIAAAAEQDIDVLFCGSNSPRRQRTIGELFAAGLVVKTLSGVYGPERDRWIARSKLVLNLHLHESKAHEIVRTSYLLSNRKAVVCECDSDTDIDADLRDAMACVPYSKLTETCVALVRDGERRRALERRAFDIFSRRDQAQMLLEALSGLALPLPGEVGSVGGEGRWEAGKRPRICLSMIVKNEAHVIERCLRSVLPYVDSWAISDTGSTDGTQERIRGLLADLPGELIERPWVDFAHNRNEALELAQKYGEYALVIDADDLFEADAEFRWGELGAPGYMFEIVFGDNQSFWRVALMRTGIDWVWEGVIHEVPVSAQLEATMKTKLHGPRIRIVGGGARSVESLELKYEKDIEVLRRALVDLPDNPRYTFYLAQALNERGRLQEAMEMYRRRVEIGGWFEEVYYSKFQIACLKERIGARHAEIVAAYLDAYEYRPQRAEALCELARYLRLNGRHASAYAFARIACSIPLPEDLVIVDTGVYHWRARDELALASFSLGDHATCVRLYEEILAVPELPAIERERMRNNLETARAALRDRQDAEEASFA